MRQIAAVLFISLLPGLPAQAAPQPSQAWQLIDKHENERIALDKARIFRLPNGNTAAWSRLTLGFDIPDSHTGERYNAIEALNSYNCKKREYMTLKRVYVDAKGHSVREEKVETPRTVEIAGGSFEEKLLPEVCKPRAVGEMKDLAEQVVAAMAPSTTAKAGASTTPARTQKAGVITIADTGGKRMIDLPKIDPSMVENPAPAPKVAPDKPNIAGTEKPAAAETPASSKAASEKAASEKAAPSSKPLQSPTVAPKKAASPTPVTAPNYHVGNVSRAEIERQLATFGPRKLKNSGPGKIAEATGGSHTTLHWSYEGKSGPDGWSHLSPDNQTCASGRRQSPIDIRDGIRVDLEPIKFSYGSTSYSVIDNGHTIQVNVAEGQNIRVMERTYQLLQFHFHKPAEERVNGRGYDMVVHLVHKDAEGRLAVVAVLLEQGPENLLIQTIWNNLPLEQGMVVSPSASIDLSRLLPEKRDYWAYMGSLTTPPCTEDVLWMVMKQPLPVSPDQLSIFGRLYPNNARPIQPANGRLVKESR
jgi:carbonic anhydrase